MKKLDALDRDIDNFSNSIGELAALSHNLVDRNHYDSENIKRTQVSLPTVMFHQFWGGGVGGGAFSSPDGLCCPQRETEVQTQDGLKSENVQTFPSAGFVWLFQQYLYNRILVLLQICTP